jgi:hypothetical protein
VSYCARTAVDAFARAAGATYELTDGSTSENRLTLRFDAARTTRETLVEGLVASLGALKDPVYQGETQVRYVD